MLMSEAEAVEIGMTLYFLLSVLCLLVTEVSLVIALDQIGFGTQVS
jgi:hypothetical protein